MQFLPAELIKKKRNGGELTGEEIRFMIDGFVDSEIPKYQMSAWLMTIYFKGMTGPETAALTEAMIQSGRTLDFSRVGITVDKHSTGGVGDKTSLILAAIAAAAGVRVPMIAGRGLGHTGGTLDKLESIPGFRIGLSLDEFVRQVETLGVAIIGQTAEICPADKKIYALRDVTATIESLPLICASIMSKKLAEGIGALVLDVKYGSGAFMKTLADADLLAEKLMEIGAAHGKRVSAFLTNMEQPLGRFIGNSLEVGECIAILKNESYLGRNDFEDCRELSLELAGQMIWLSGRATTEAEGLAQARATLTSGRAWTMFEKICAAQGGDWKALPMAKTKVDVLARQDGFVFQFDTEKIGIAALALGAGRAKTNDKIEPTAGFELHHKLGDGIRKGERLFTIYSDHPAGHEIFAKTETMLLQATSISLQKPLVGDLITRRKTPKAAFKG